MSNDMKTEDVLDRDEITEIAEMAQAIEDFALEKAAPGEDTISMRDIAVIGLAAGGVRLKMERFCAEQAGREKMPDAFQRYCVVMDDSGHSYYIPYAEREDWGKWTEIDPDDERSWEVPSYAVRIEGTLTFIAPKVM